MSIFGGKVKKSPSWTGDPIFSHLQHHPHIQMWKALESKQTWSSRCRWPWVQSLGFRTSRKLMSRWFVNLHILSVYLTNAKKPRRALLGFLRCCSIKNGDLPSLEEIHIVKLVQLYRKLKCPLYFRHDIIPFITCRTERERGRGCECNRTSES